MITVRVSLANRLNGTPFKVEVRYALFDNEHTLYNPSQEFRNAILNKLYAYISSSLGIGHDDLESEAQILRDRYGKRPMIVLFSMGHNLPFAEMSRASYLDVDPSDFGITSDNKLAESLNSIPIRKSIHTNSPSDFGFMIIKALGLEGCFEKVIGPDNLDFEVKPAAAALAKALKIAGYVTDESIFIDNNPEVAHMADGLGMHGITVGRSNSTTERNIDTIYDLVRMFRSE